MSGPINKIGPNYYRINNPGGEIRIFNIQILRGIMLRVPRGWDRSLTQGMKIESIDFNPNTKGIRGKVFYYDSQRNEVAVSEIDLPHYRTSNPVEHLEAVVEIVPSQDGSKLVVIERRLETKSKLTEDRSKYIYYLYPSACGIIEREIPDLGIRKIEVTPEKNVKITYQTPNSSNEKTLTLPGSLFYDNFGRTLLENPKQNVSRPEDIYQADFYTPETERFAPRIDYYNGKLCFIVHKVRRYEIDKPEAIKVPKGTTFKIFPAFQDAVATVKTKTGETIEVPIAFSEPMGKKVEKMIDYNLSQVEEGQIQSAVGPQTRLGEPGNISSQYPRDPYFYGLVCFALARIIEKLGENFGLNRAKANRALRGIQSGRTHIMPVKLLFNELADIMETNSEYHRKLSNFAEEIWGPGVSEDTQMEIACFLRGIRMWVIKETIAIMNSEKEWGLYNKQNTQRYIYSEALFQLATLLALVDIVEGRFLGTKPVLMKWGEISEIVAGRTWYKVGLAKLVEFLGVPVYLATLGHILFFPVDLSYFVGSWIFRTIASSINYTRHLCSLGYGFITGFWINPALELTMLRGYVKGAIQQFLMRNQYGTFVMTRSGSGEIIPKENRRLIWGLTAASLLGLGIGTFGLIAVGSASLLLLPLGLVALPLNLHLARNSIIKKQNWFTKTLKIATAVAGVIGSATLIVIGTPVLWTNPLSIAIIVNLVFGAYGLGLLLNSINIMRKVEKSAIDPVPQKKIDDLPKTDQNTISQTKKALANLPSLSYDELAGYRSNLREILIKIGIMDRNGNLTQGEEHPWRMVSFEILELHSRIETAMLMKACRDLTIGQNIPEAKKWLVTILTQTREPFLIEYGLKFIRQHKIKLGPERRSIRQWISDLMK